MVGLLSALKHDRLDVSRETFLSELYFPIVMAGGASHRVKKTGPKPCCDDALGSDALVSSVAGSNERRLSSQDFDRAPVWVLLPFVHSR